MGATNAEESDIRTPTIVGKDITKLSVIEHQPKNAHIHCETTANDRMYAIDKRDPRG